MTKLVLGLAVFFGVHSISMLARQPARAMIALPAQATNDVVASVAGLALYAVFMFWLHARWFGVPPLNL